MLFLEVLQRLLALGLIPGSLTEFDDFPDIFEGRPLQRLSAVAPPPLKLRVIKSLLGDFNDDGTTRNDCEYEGRGFSVQSIGCRVTVTVE